MSLIIATGTNVDDLEFNLLRAKKSLSQHFKLTAQSRIYQSKAILKSDQPDFLNQVLEFSIPEYYTPQEVLNKALFIEKQMGRVRTEKYAARNIDIDLIFWDLLEINDKNLIIPHPEWHKRSFVVRPLMELPFFEKIKDKFNFSTTFEIDATPY